MFCDFPKHKHLKCTIYRGTGGGGDATTDSQITALAAYATQAQTQAELATTAAGNAATSASNASTSASNAAASAATAANTVAIVEALAGVAPPQTGNAGKFLTTDATNTSWAAVPYASVTGTPTLGTAAATDSTAYVSSSVGSIGFKNRIINGAMVIDQRNAGASVTPTDQQLTLDRWKFRLGAASKISTQQSSTVPAGFTNSLLVTSLSSYSSGASEQFYLNQRIEGYNVADLGWGAAGASTVTLSFWVRSSLTGTFGGAVFNADANRSYPFTFTISSANTFEYKTVTIAGDTTGTWNTGNSIGISLAINLGSGSSLQATAGTWASGFYPNATGATSVVGTNGATFYITGVQLEKGSTATSFDYRPFGTELALCQRYYEIVHWLVNGYWAQWTGVEFCGAQCPFMVEKRASPSIANFISNGYWVAAGQTAFSAQGAHSFTISYSNTKGFTARSNRPVGNSTPVQANMYLWESSVSIPVSAEL